VIFIDTQSEGRSAAIRTDALCVVLITLVTVVPYVARLGFYSDDWYVLWTFHADTIQHNFGIHSALRDRYDRPLQGLYLALLYTLFGFHPFGYHLVNAAVIAAALGLFYWLLVRMKVDRPMAIGATIVLVTLPQLSTVRVWYLTFQIPLSMLAAWVSLHCQLSFARTGKISWAAAAGFAAIASIAAYEIFAPLIAVFPIALLAPVARERLRRPVLRQRAMALLSVVAVVALAAVAKFAVSERTQAPSLHRYFKGLIQLVRPDYDWRTDFGLNIFAAADVNFWWPILGWWRGAEALIRGEFGWLAAAAAVVVSSLALWRLRAAPDASEAPWNNARLMLLGIATFVLGHAAFVVVPAMSFSPTGMGNRALAAAAPGVALILVAAVRFVGGLVNAQRRSLFYSSAVAAIAFFGTLRVLQIEEYWTQAPAIQQRIFAAARRDLRDVPPQSFVMLDNVCPYHGPAVIFEAPWDVSGALSLAAGKTIRGDAISSRMSLRRDGLATSIYGEPAFYPYGSNLYVYDPNRRRLVELRDFAAARRYFSEAGATRLQCPPGYLGQGVLI
jgi:hypothetical protein